MEIKLTLVKILNTIAIIWMLFFSCSLIYMFLNRNSIRPTIFLSSSMGILMGLIGMVFILQFCNIYYKYHEWKTKANG